MAGVRMDNDILERVGWEYVPKDSLKLNVLMFGFDSLSRLTFMRKLPKSYEKLQSLDTVVLNGYNIIGDGTPQALIPLLTGQYWILLGRIVYHRSKFISFLRLYREDGTGNAGYQKTDGFESDPRERVSFRVERFQEIWLRYRLEAFVL